MATALIDLPFDSKFLRSPRSTPSIVTTTADVRFAVAKILMEKVLCCHQRKPQVCAGVEILTGPQPHNETKESQAADPPEMPCGMRQDMAWKSSPRPVFVSVPSFMDGTPEQASSLGSNNEGMNQTFEELELEIGRLTVANCRPPIPAPTPDYPTNSSASPLNGGGVGCCCEHTEHWKHLRSRRGCAYMMCFFCGTKWRVRYATPVKKSPLGPRQINQNPTVARNTPIQFGAHGPAAAAIVVAAPDSTTFPCLSALRFTPLSGGNEPNGPWLQLQQQQQLHYPRFIHPESAPQVPTL